MLTDYFHPHLGGGVEKVVYEISRRLIKLGCDVTVLTFNTDNSRSFEYVEGVKVYRVNPVDLTRSMGVQLTVSPWVPFHLMKILKNEKPEIINANNRFFFTTMCAVALKNSLKRPLVTTMHLGSMQFEQGLLSLVLKIYEKTISRWIVGKSDRIIAVGNAVREQAIALGASPKKIRVVFNGIDLDEFEPKCRSRVDAKVIRRVIYVGRLIFNKGIMNLIDAAQIVLREYPKVEFVIVGTGPLQKEAKTRVRQLDMVHAFKFLGNVRSVSEILSDCDIFVRPSLTEATPGGLAAIEAMSCGLPVIVTRLSRTDEVVLDGQTGLLVEPGNNNELANYLMLLLRDKQLADRLGKNASSYIRENFSWDKTAKLTLQVYEECLALGN